MTNTDGTDGVNEHVYGNGAAKKFTLNPEPVENLRPLRVVVVGAGFSGIAAAIRQVLTSRPAFTGLTVFRIPEKLRNVDLTVYEKNERVGGVWYEHVM